MTEVTIDKIESNFDHILGLTGENSFVEWDSFTKSSTGLSKQIDELAKSLHIYRDIQHKRFIQNMKKLKGCDIPDLVKTIKSKKLPKEALTAIKSRFQLNGDQVELVEPANKLKEEASKICKDYVSSNDILMNKLQECTALLKEKTKDSGLVEEQLEAKELISTFKHSFAEDRLEIAKTAVHVEYLPGTVDTLHIKTYAQIVDASLELVKPEYRRLTQDSRENQRKLQLDSKEYINGLLQYLTNTEVLIIDAQKSIAATVGITAQKLQQSENMLMEKGLAQNLLMIQSSLRSKVKESMTPNKEATLEQAKQILSFQVSKLKSETQMFKRMFAHLDKTPENYQLIPMILALCLNDMVFKKYELEEQDFMKNVGDQVIMTNKDVMIIFRDMELAIIKLMQELGIITPEAGNYMASQAQVPNPTANPNLMGGMQPGTNPLQLLQMQQRQQFQQMQRSGQQSKGKQEQPPK